MSLRPITTTHSLSNVMSRSVYRQFFCMRSHEGVVSFLKRGTEQSEISKISPKTTISHTPLQACRRVSEFIELIFLKLEGSLTNLDPRCRSTPTFIKPLLPDLHGSYRKCLLKKPASQNGQIKIKPCKLDFSETSGSCSMHYNSKNVHY